MLLDPKTGRPIIAAMKEFASNVGPRFDGRFERMRTIGVHRRIWKLIPFSESSDEGRVLYWSMLVSGIPWSVKMSAALILFWHESL